MYLLQVSLSKSSLSKTCKECLVKTVLLYEVRNKMRYSDAAKNTINIQYFDISYNNNKIITIKNCFSTLTCCK